MSDFWKDYEPEPTRPAPMTKDELTEPLGCVVVRPLLANSTTPPVAQRQWVGLTDEERKFVRNSVGYNQFVTAGEYAEHVQKATEDKLRSKNDG